MDVSKWFSWLKYTSVYDTINMTERLLLQLWCRQVWYCLMDTQCSLSLVREGYSHFEDIQVDTNENMVRSLVMKLNF